MPVGNLLNNKKWYTSCSGLNYGVDSPYYVCETSYCDSASCCVELGAYKLPLWL